MSYVGNRVSKSAFASALGSAAGSTVPYPTSYIFSRLSGEQVVVSILLDQKTLQFMFCHPTNIYAI